MADSGQNSSNGFLQMFPQLGVFAVFLTVLGAISGLDFGNPWRPEKESPSASSAKKTFADSAPSNTKDSSVIQKLIEYDVLVPQSEKPKISLWPCNWLGLGCPTLQLVHPTDFLIVTVPDPIESALGARFDQSMDAIGKALAETGEYSLDRFWLPWQFQQGTSQDKAPNGVVIPLYRDCPGLLVYRNPNGIVKKMVILLVGESPIGGVHPAAFKTALTIAMLSKKNVIKIVGPNFTGAQYSIVDQIHSWRYEKGQIEREKIKFNVMTGSALGIRTKEELIIRNTELTIQNETLCMMHERFQESCKGLVVQNDETDRIHKEISTQYEELVMQNWDFNKQKETISSIEFTSNCASLKEMKKSVEDYFKKYSSTIKVAYLIESTSGFGNRMANIDSNNVASSSKDQVSANKPWILRYPMHLSKAAGIQAQEDREKNRRIGIPDTLTPRQIDTSQKTNDIITPANEEETGLSNQKALQDYWIAINREKISHIGIISSDIGDRLFLASEIKKKCPDIIIFHFGLDLQLAHPSNLEAMRGTIAVTTYPLNQICQEWAKRSMGITDFRKLMFTSSNGEGIYNAILVQLEKNDKTADSWTTQSALYTPPPIWIMTIAENGDILPLSVRINGFGLDLSKDNPLAKKLSDSYSLLMPPFNHLRILGLLTMLAAVSATSFLRRAWKRLDQYSDSTRHRHQLAAYGLLTSSALWTSTTILSAFFYRAHFFYVDMNEYNVISMINPTIMIAAIVSVSLYSAYSIFYGADAYLDLGRNKNSEAHNEQITKDSFLSSLNFLRLTDWMIFILFFLNTTGMLFLATMISSIFLYDDLFALYAERYANFFASFSPIYAVAIIAFGFYLFGMLSIGHSLINMNMPKDRPYPNWVDASQYPQWNKIVSDSLAKLHSCADELYIYCRSLSSFLWHKSVRVAIILVLISLSVVVPVVIRLHRTWEGWFWDIAFLVGFGLLFFLAVVSTYRFFEIWKSIERLTRYISRIPMTNAFKELPEASRRVFVQTLLGSRCRSEDMLLQHSILCRLAKLRNSPPRMPASIIRRIRQLDPACQSVHESSFNSDRSATLLIAHESELDPYLEVESSETDALTSVQAVQFNSVSREMIQQISGRWHGRPEKEAYCIMDESQTSGENEKSEDSDKSNNESSSSKTPEWQKLSEQFIAGQVILFLSQYMQQLRIMAFLAVIPVVTLLVALTSYPFMPERRIMFSATLLVLMVLGVLGYVIYRININPLFNRINKTSSRFTFDIGLLKAIATFVLPLVLVAVVKLGGRWRSALEPFLDLIR